MNEIKTIDTDVIQHAVILRDVWSELEIKRKYTDWANDQLELFVEKQDYDLLHFSEKQKGSGGHNKIDHIVSIEVAKHIALMSRTEKGREYRQRLIELEEGRIKLRTPLELAREQVRLLERQERLENEKKELQITLDKEKEWSSIKRQEYIHDMKFDWRPLKRYSVANQYEIKRVFDQNYGYVNSYHADVWLAVYEIEL